jgi:hypothetical protein
VSVLREEGGAIQEDTGGHLGRPPEKLRHVCADGSDARLRLEIAADAGG